jgi:hypothetical protein
MNIQELKEYSHNLRNAADQIDAAVETIEGLGDIPIPVGGKKPATTHAKRKPSPAGARRSIHHPNETDVLVLDAFLAVKNDGTEEIKAADVLTKLQEKDSSFEKAELQKSIKWFNSANIITTNGRGRGTFYTLNVSTNDLQVVDPSTLANYRNPDGPTVVQIVRAIFNSLEPMQRMSPAEVVEAARECFPDQNLERSSFGTVFSQMAKNDELFHAGEGRGRQYWRGPNKLDDAAEFPDDPPTIENKSNETQATG